MENIPARDDQSLEEAEKRARKRVKELKDFYTHAAIFTVVNVFLFFINITTSPDYLWAFWPLAGWGLGLIIHAVDVYGIFGIGSKEWELRKVREIMLQEQDTLSAEQVRQLLRQELGTETPASSARIIQRLENLEAIVTSEDWDLLQRAKGQEGIAADAGRDEDVDSEREVERIARRVR